MRTSTPFADPMMRPMNTPDEDDSDLFGQADEADYEPPSVVPVPVPTPPPALVPAPARQSAEDDLPDMDRAEATEADATMRQSKALQAIRLYLFDRRKGWKQLNCSSMTDYVEKRLNESHQVVSNWMAQVENTCIVKNISLKNLATMLRNEIEKPIEILPQTVTRELAKLPNADVKRKVYNQMQALKRANVATAPEYNREWRRIVQMELGILEARTPSAPPAPPVTTPRPAPPVPPPIRPAIPADTAPADPAPARADQPPIAQVTSRDGDWLHLTGIAASGEEFHFRIHVDDVKRYLE